MKYIETFYDPVVDIWYKRIVEAETPPPPHLNLTFGGSEHGSFIATRRLRDGDLDAEGNLRTDDTIAGHTRRVVVW